MHVRTLPMYYDFLQHVASDVGIGDRFLPPTKYGMQETLNQLSTWTSNNLMNLNAAKCNYMIFSRSKDSIGKETVHKNPWCLDQ